MAIIGVIFCVVVFLILFVMYALRCCGIMPFTRACDICNYQDRNWRHTAFGWIHNCRKRSNKE